MVEEKALQQIVDTIRQAQSYGNDAFHLGRWLYAWHPDLLEIDSWPDQFAALPITFEMDTAIEVH